MPRALLATAALLFAGLPATAEVITVGPSGDFTTISAAVASANAGDEIQVSTGLYVNDFSAIEIPLTIVGIGATPILQATVQPGNGKGIFVVRANLVIQNLEFRDVRVSDNNGAGIRLEVGDLTVEDSIFRNNQMGILTNDDANGDVIVRNSDFIGNGAETGPNIGHAVYANFIDTLLVEDSTFIGQLIGHDIKSRALETTILRNTLDDGVAGTASFAIDLSNGGVGIIDHNVITQGAGSPNRTMIAYGAARDLPDVNSLLVRCNVFTNSGGAGTSVRNFTTSVSADLRGNTFINVPTPLAGPGTISSDVCSDVSAIAEPGPLGLLAFALGGLALLARRRSASSVAMRSRSFSASSSARRCCR
jgi:MYXO-CTERM domain-containing protein